MKTLTAESGARQIAAYLVVYIGGILLFCMLTIVPGRSELAELDRQYTATQKRLEDQKVLVPFFKQLVGRINFKPPEGLALAVPAAMPRADTVHLRKVFERLAADSDVTIARFKPDFARTADRPNLLFLNLALSGQVSGFRELLLKISSLPYTKHVEQVRIRTVQDYREAEMKVWLALK